MREYTRAKWIEPLTQSILESCTHVSLSLEVQSFQHRAFIGPYYSTFFFFKQNNVYDPLKKL